MNQTDDHIFDNGQGNGKEIAIEARVAFLSDFYRITADQAQYAVDVSRGLHPERLEKIRDSLGRTPLIADVIYACKGIYKGVPSGWGGAKAIGDALEQEECYKCNATFTPKQKGQHLCPACEAQEYDHYHRREDGALLAGAVGS